MSQEGIAAAIRSGRECACRRCAAVPRALLIPVALLNLERSTDERAAWWAPRENGYVYAPDHAGVYELSCAIGLVRRGRGGDVPVPLEWAFLYARACQW